MEGRGNRMTGMEDDVHGRTDTYEDRNMDRQVEAKDKAIKQMKRRDK